MQQSPGWDVSEFRLRSEASCHWGTWGTCPQTVWRLWL